MPQRQQKTGFLRGLTACTLVLLSAWCGRAFGEDEVFVAEITVPNERALHGLLAGDYVVDAVRGLSLTAYLSRDQLEQVRALGVTVKVIETQYPGRIAKALDGYTTPDEIGLLFANYATQYPSICRAQSLGQSVQGRELWAILISDNPNIEEDEPEFKYVSTMHGDETVGTETCLNFVDTLLQGYASDARVQGLVDSTVIWVVPTMNPDGFMAITRYNANGRDLNRTFPSYPVDYDGTYYDGASSTIATREPEQQAVMQWSMDNSFVLSANFHTGALLVNYPYDNVPGISSGQDAPSPDDLLCEDVALRYSSQNPPMYASPVFTNGISNGSAWYSITGGMQDWCYRYTGCIDMTIELYNTKRPHISVIPQLWSDNEEAMFAYLEAVHLGARGMVLDRASGAPVWAQVNVAGNAQPVFTDPDVGDYHRLLLPGTYNLSFSATGYITYHVDGVQVVAGPATRTDISLSSGDVNQDGAVNAADIQETVNTILGRASSYDTDVDGRGLSATDLQAVVNRVLLR